VMVYLFPSRHHLCWERYLIVDFVILFQTCLIMYSYLSWIQSLFPSSHLYCSASYVGCLLQLLAKEVHREFSAVLQCFRHLTNNQFFVSSATSPP
jgi:uncharacterized membrane protein YcjF (UPF0283 family)